RIVTAQKCVDGITPNHNFGCVSFQNFGNRCYHNLPVHRVASDSHKASVKADDLRLIPDLNSGPDRHGSGAEVSPIVRRLLAPRMDHVKIYGSPSDLVDREFTINGNALVYVAVIRVQKDSVTPVGVCVQIVEGSR